MFFCPGACGPPGDTLDVPPARWAALTCSWAAVGLLGIVFGHQATLRATQGGRRRRLLELKIKDFHRFLLVFIDFRWFSSISIGFH